MPLTECRPLERLGARSIELFSEEDVRGSVGARIALMVRRHAHRPALVHAGETVTYNALNLRAGDLMRRIADAETSDDALKPVGVLTSDPVLRIVGMLTAQKLGRPFLPLDPAAPPGRLQLILRDSRCSALITDHDPRFKSVLTSFHRDKFFEWDAPAPQDLPDRYAASRTASHILYTSGSTGQPKSIAQTHAMVMHKMAEYSSSLRINPDDRLSLVASPGFAESWNAVFMALLNGATLCIREAKHHGIEGLAEWMQQSEVTMFHCVPTLLRAIVTGLPHGVYTPQLRLLILGGETLSRADLQACWSRLNPDCVIVNSYGTTETKLIAHFFVDRETEITSKTIPVGRPIPDTQVRIIGDDGTPVPDGDVGEIEVCSSFIARRYERGTDADQQRFSPVDGDPYLVKYRTGDLGRFVDGGLLEHLGRHDGIVKLRGYRIEIAEVESTLQTHPSVRQAVVVVHSPSQRATQLVAAYKCEGTPTKQELHDHLARLLPDYMIPSRLIQVDDFPVNVNGKVDRKRLLERLQSALDGNGSVEKQPLKDSETALSSTLRTLLVQVRSVLEIERVAPEDGFIELGGDSLSATELLVCVQKEFGVDLSREQLFDAKNLIELAELIDARTAHS